MEENNFNNDMPAEDFLAPSVVEEAPAVEAPVLETKVEEVAVENNIEASISAPVEETSAITTSDLAKSSLDEVQALGSVANGVIGAVSVPKTEKKASVKSNKAKKTVAVYSTKNVSWGGVGKVNRGYNIVTQEEADKWATRDHIRIATAEEIAREFGR